MRLVIGLFFVVFAQAASVFATTWDITYNASRPNQGIYVIGRGQVSYNGNLADPTLADITSFSMQDVVNQTNCFACQADPSHPVDFVTEDIGLADLKQLSLTVDNGAVTGVLINTEASLASSGSLNSYFFWLDPLLVATDLFAAGEMSFTETDGLTPVPEPASLGIAGLGLAMTGLAISKLRKRA